MPDTSLNFFSRAEEGYYLKFRQWRDRLMQPFCAWLTKKKVTPNMMTGAGFLMMFGFVYFFLFNPWISLLFLVLNLFLDGLDGALARFQKVESVRGDLLDHAFDNLNFFLVFLTFLSFQLVNSFWGAIFLLNYPVLIFLMVILKMRKIDFFLVIRCKYFVYLVFLVWLITGENYFDPVVIFFSVYMVMTNLFLFRKLQCSFS